MKKKKEKKIKMSITIDGEVFEKLNFERINKSKLVNWVLREYYESLRGSDE